ncbi:MAG: hypothetical protein WCT20_01755 [Candidatus Babeliales bacterium]|jgi:hypothetical protein
MKKMLLIATLIAGNVIAGIDQNIEIKNSENSGQTDLAQAPETQTSVDPVPESPEQSVGQLDREANKDFEDIKKQIEQEDEQIYQIEDMQTAE